MQTTHQMLRALRGLGLKFSLSNDLLAVRPRDLLCDEARDAIRSRRDELVQIISEEAQPPSIHDVLERAAILEFEGGLSRADADRLALAEYGVASWDELRAPEEKGATA